jgi:hypothetical protein
MHRAWGMTSPGRSIVKARAFAEDLATLTPDEVRKRARGHSANVAHAAVASLTRQDLDALLARVDRHEPQLALAA